jgi:hypothetical protein
MTEELLESLLYRSESETLDFKEGQYAFAGATPEQKAELLKDVLAFANAWRDTEARILIGVREIKHAKSIVIGIQDHLDDHSLQQFVNGKTNRPIPFSYSAFATGRLRIGVLTLAVTDQRPFFLNQDFGKLRRNVTYIRRGSSTDEADPDEVTSMAIKASATAQPVLLLEFCDGSSRKGMGQSVELHPQLLKLPKSKAFPCYGKPSHFDAFGAAMPTGSMDNNDYYVDAANYLKSRLAYASVSLGVSNSSEGLAEAVVITIRADSASKIQVADEDDFPDRPSRYGGPLGRITHPPLACSTRVALYGSHYEIKIDIGNVQPGQTAYSTQPFYLSSEADLDITLEATISANNLRSPLRVPLSFALRPETAEVTVPQVIKFAEDHLD